MVNHFKGKVCVFMGAAQFCDRKCVRDELTAAGGIFGNDVTAFTNYVIAFKGAEKTRKYEKVARYTEHGMLTVLNEQQFLAILDGKMSPPELPKTDNGVVVYLEDNEQSGEILNKNDFTFEVFKTEKIGDSGVLKIATLKSDKTVQYIIKSECPSFACNEFMYHHIAKALGLYTQEVRLFQNEGDLYPVGIRYAENIREFSYNKEENEENKRNYHLFETLFVILNEEDSHEYFTDKRGKLFKLDNAASFNMNLMTYGFLTWKGELPEPLRHSTQNCLYHTERDKYEIRIEILTKYYGQESVNISFEMFKAFSELDVSLLENAFATLRKVYPSPVVDYYREFVQIRKEECKRFILENSRELLRS